MKIKNIDISMCENLEILSVLELKFLESVKTSEKNKKLRVANFTQLNTKNNLKELNFSNLPVFEYLYYYTIKESQEFDLLDVSNTPKLKLVDVAENVLKEIKLGNSESLETLDFTSCNLTEVMLLDIINSLVDIPYAGETEAGCTLKIGGNPGLTSRVQEAVGKLEHWTVTYNQSK